MSKSKSILIAALALGLCGCATTTTRSAAPAQARIVLEPSDDTYKSALEGLSAADRKTLKKGLGFTVDTLLHAPTPVETMAWSRRRQDTPLDVNISDFVRYVDLQPALGGGTRVNLATARVLAGLTYDAATFDPVFRIQVEVEPPSGNVMTATALGAGPPCARPGDEFPPGSSKFTRSEEVAFMRAFLKTLLTINYQLQQS